MSVERTFDPSRGAFFAHAGVVIASTYRVILGGALSLALASCGYSAKYGCEVSCASDGPCPDGFTCKADLGLCRPADPTMCGAAPSGDATTDTGDASLVKPPSFAASIDFPTEMDPTTVAIGDFNGDGKPDLAVVNYVSTTVSVLLNTTVAGSTVPSFMGEVGFPTGGGPYSVAIGDFNGDGKPDLAVANLADSANTVAVLLNTTATDATTPSFASKVEFATGSGIPSIAIGDINADGKPDLVVSNSDSSSVSVLLNTTVTGATTPSFAAKVDLTSGSADTNVGVAIGDVNRDGKPDIVITNEGSNTFSVFLNTTVANATTPSFAVQADFPAPGTPVVIAIADLNGDGSPDVAIPNYGAATVSVLLDTTATGASTLSFGSDVEFTTDGGYPSIAIGDLNRDGKPDLAVTNTEATGVAVLANTTTTGATTPSFATKIDFTTGPQPSSVAIGDLNGDGKPDLAVVIPAANAVSVLLAQ